MTLIVQMGKGCIVTVSMINGTLRSHNVIKEIEMWIKRKRPPGFTCDYDFLLLYIMIFSYLLLLMLLYFLFFSSCNMKFLQKIRVG